jgi:hypothetical protein
MRDLLKEVAFYFVLLFPFGAFSQGPSPAGAERGGGVFFSREGGFYERGLELELEAPGATIYYTLNGAKPDRKSTRYRGPIRLDRTAVVRAVAYWGGRRGSTIGHTYFIREPASDFPTISISLPSWMLFDKEKGLFMQGSKAIDTIMSLPGANFWSRKEVLVNTEIFEPGGRCVFRSESGMRLFGGLSRLFPQKSLVLVARDRYGQKRIKYPIFGEKGLKSYKFLVLRNGGSDWGKAHFRDGLMTGLVKDWNLDVQDYRPAHVYINGEYWGIYNIREKINRYFLAAHHGVHKDSIDLLEHFFSLKRGTRRHYRELLDFLRTHDLSNPANFAYLNSLMEVDNYLDHQVAQIYFDNQDAGGNIKFWRPHSPNGRWRWVLFDTDWGFGLHDPMAYLNNSLAFHTEPNGPHWPNPPWSTFLLRKLLENPDFQKAFVNRFADRLNTTLRPEHVEARIDELYQALRPEMPRHLRRWRLSPATWEEHVNIMRTFARERPTYMRMHLMERFNTGRQMRLQVETTAGGTVILNDNLHLRAGEFSGYYFENIPVYLKALPDYGYRFSHWEGVNVREGLRELTFNLREKTTTLRAVFEPFTHQLADKIVINEISPNDKKSGDWIELFNLSKHKVSLKSWVLADLKNEFVLPDVAIGPNDYLVISQDSAKFRGVFPRAYNVIGGMEFGLNKRREVIKLYSSEYAAVDSVYYELPPMDTVFTLNLLLPYLDNSSLENWEIRPGHGTPNAANPYYVESSIRQLQEQWVQVGAAVAVILLCVLMLYLRAKSVF